MYNTTVRLEMLCMLQVATQTEETEDGLELVELNIPQAIIIVFRLDRVNE